MKASVFIGTSLDGFIARENGDLDVLPPGGGAPITAADEPLGGNEMIATIMSALAAERAGHQATAAMR